MSCFDAGHDGAGPFPNRGDPVDLRRDKDLEEVVLRLVVRFGDRVPRSDLEILVREAAAGFEDVRIRSFVPILIEHQVAEWIHAALRREARHEPGIGAAG